jgi:hypothetical protein
VISLLRREDNKDVPARSTLLAIHTLAIAIGDNGHMQDVRAALLGRLDAIASSLARRQGTLALLGLGSVGADRGRLDAYSDLDFFVIAGQDYIVPLIDSLAWLEAVAPIAFAFQNTDDGWKVLFEDGVYAEFAIFTPDRLRSIPFDGARLIWQREGVDLSDALRPRTSLPGPPASDWLVGEILTNLYVGLTRLKRGEALSAQRLIQVHAVDRLLDLWPSIETAAQASRDPFDGARRAEQRFPRMAPYLARFIQGYGCSPESALAILACLQARITLDPTLSRRISELATEIIADP